MPMSIPMTSCQNKPKKYIYDIPYSAGKSNKPGHVKEITYDHTFSSKAPFEYKVVSI